MLYRLPCTYVHTFVTELFRYCPKKQRNKKKDLLSLTHSILFFLVSGEKKVSGGCLPSGPVLSLR